MRGWNIIILLFLPALLPAQTAPGTYWIQFTDKDNTPYSLDQPQEFLSDRAIQRRQTQNIPFDELDLPVDPAYIATVLALGDVQLHNRSKWFNAITIRTSDPGVLDDIAVLPFVQQIRSTRTWVTGGNVPEKFPITTPWSDRELSYGPSFTQIAMMNGHLLHELSQGEGMLIGVLDSGFDRVDSIAAFEPLRDRNGIVLTRDLVAHDGDVYTDNWHGRSVLSCMAAIFPDSLIGTAPEADYVLLRTEDADSEYIVEEDNWIAGAELCDSLGCDVLNTSLGYTRFDDPEQDHSYTDLDGNTTRISIAAGIASAKGMIPVQSAGNSGESDWFYISAAADAHDILAVGAVGDLGQPAPFSGHGPSADGRVKPDVSAMGWGTIGLDLEGTGITPINGTSFSAPLVAGLVACLWKLHPQRTASEIMDAVRRSASHYQMPESQLGYGIPDFMLAHDLLVMSIGIDEGSASGLAIHPMPFTDRLEITIDITGLAVVDLFDHAGRKVWSRDGIMIEQGKLLLNGPELARLGAGCYVLSIATAEQRITRQVVKAWN